MANSTINLGVSPNGYIGQPSLSGIGQGQILASNDSGPLSKVITGIGTSTMDGASTTITLNFIDGVQKLAQSQLTLALQSAAAPVTINGVANQAVYQGVGGMGQIAVGQSVTFAGFSNGGNNGTFTVNAVGPNFVQVTNASSVAETNYAATLSTVIGARVAAVVASRSGANFAGTADTANTAAGVVSVTSITNVGCTLTLNAAGSAGTASFIVTIYFAS